MNRFMDYGSSFVQFPRLMEVYDYIWSLSLIYENPQSDYEFIWIRTCDLLFNYEY